ncbi:MAG: LytTR family transcriptional regulator [Butyrivibrio sp.]|nr:LytTR family transcriptional regulator [Butyrivibrio sp.]
MLYGKKDGDTVSLEPGEILYIESVDDKVFAYTQRDVIRLEGSLAGLLEDLNDVRFFRCSKSMIINIEKVERLKSLSSNRIDATMAGGEHILISRTYASDFRRVLKGG